MTPQHSALSWKWENAQSREIVQPISLSNEGETKTVLSLKNPELSGPVRNYKCKCRNQIHSVDAAKKQQKSIPQKLLTPVGCVVGWVLHIQGSTRCFFSPLSEKAEWDAMPVHQQVEQERLGLAQSAGETVLRRPNSRPASRRDHEEAKTRHFIASQGRRVRNNHRLIKWFRL